MAIIDTYNLLTTDENKEKRISICDECHLKTMQLGKKLCTECNCFINAKVMFKKTSCPLGKW